MLFRQPIIFFKLDNLPSIISSKYLPKLYRYYFCVLSTHTCLSLLSNRKVFFLIAAYLFSDKGMTYGTSKLLFNHPPKEILFSSKIKGIVTEDFFCLQLNEILNKRATVEFGHLQEDCMKCQDQFSFSEMFNTTDKLTLNKLSFERCMGLWNWITRQSKSFWFILGDSKSLVIKISIIWMETEEWNRGKGIEL